MRAAVVQMNSTTDRDRNLEVAERLVRAAAADGARLVVLPEKWNLLGSGEDTMAGAEPADGPAATAASSWARGAGVHVLAGSMALLEYGHDRPSNASLLFGPDGRLLALYRKVHMFDVDVGGVSYRESAHQRPGHQNVVAPLAGDLDGLRLGMTICYDLRFPELYRAVAMAGAHFVVVPSAFTEATGRDHWEVLLRARAIENQLFVIAAGQWGPAPPRHSWHGRSIVVDPWGTVLCQVPDGEGYACADLDLTAIERVRSSVPSLASRRPAAYGVPADAAH